MNDINSKLSLMDTPSLDEADRIVQETRDQFNRTLACWASDVLRLQRDGLDTPCWHSGDPTTQWSKAA